MRYHRWWWVALASVFAAGAAFAVSLRDGGTGEGDGPRPVGAYAPALEGLDPDIHDLYRIASDDRSSVTYWIAEERAGTTATATGTTVAVAGDIAIDAEDPNASRVGTIAVNVEQLSSDSNLRDQRLRTEFLYSSDYPLAEFTTTEVTGLDALVDDQAADLVVYGYLQIAETVAPATFEGVASLDAEVLEATLATSISLANFGIGPIEVPGLVSTDDTVHIELDLVADRIEVGTPAPEGRILYTEPTDVVESDFAETIQPIVERRCAACHTGEGAGANTVALDTAGDVAAIAPDIELVARLGYMPPWPASDTGVEMLHDASLSDDELDAIAAWVDAGGGLDVDPNTAIVARDPSTEPIERDVLSRPDEAYLRSVDRLDVYRCVVSEVPDPEGDGTWVVGVDLEPEEPAIVQHATISAVGPASRAIVDDLERADWASGFNCDSPIGARPDVDAWSLASWVPGEGPTRVPEGYAHHLPSGSFLVTRIHYHYDHIEPPDRSTVVLDTVSSAEVDERRTTGEALRTIEHHALANPVEGPCGTGAQAPLCDRDAALDALEETEGPQARALPDAHAARCGTSVDEIDDLEGTSFSSTCDHRLSEGGTVLAVQPHLGQRGASYRVTIDPGGRDERVILDIPRWSFAWQLAYQPDDEIRIGPDDVIRITCTWDRDRIEAAEPRYLTWGSGPDAERCLSEVAVLPDG